MEKSLACNGGILFHGKCTRGSGSAIAIEVALICRACKEEELNSNNNELNSSLIRARSFLSIIRQLTGLVPAITTFGAARALNKSIG
jgi:hypothetical protein